MIKESDKNYINAEKFVTFLFEGDGKKGKIRNFFRDVDVKDITPINADIVQCSIKQEDKKGV